MRQGVIAQLWDTTKGFRLRLAVIFATTTAAAYLRYGLAVSYQHTINSLTAVLSVQHFTGSQAASLSFLSGTAETISV